MGWDERQAAMLAEMGIRLWSPPAPAGAADGAGPEAPERPFARPAAPPAMDEAPAGRAAPAMRRPEGAGALPAAGAERAAAIAGLDWPALSKAVTGCTACSLCRGRTRTVFGVGHPAAHCMVIGEAPGEQEDRQGEPFVGKAGQLLDAMLRAAGLGRLVPAGAQGEGDPATRVYIANVLKCRPPLNRNPAPDEVALCEPFLRRQIALVRPRVILAMGRYAVSTLLGSDAPIGRLRGRVHEFEGVPTVVTYHPAYLLRNPSDKARAWDDLCLALERLRAAPVRGGVPGAGAP